MKTVQNAVTKTDSKPHNPVNFTQELVDRFKGIDGLTIPQALAKYNFSEVHLVTTKGKEGAEILNVGLEFPDEIVLFGFSRGIDLDGFKEDIGTFRNKFYLRNRMQEGDEVGNPTGPLGISYGKLGTVEVIESIMIDDLVESAPAKPVGNKK